MKKLWLSITQILGFQTLEKQEDGFVSLHEEHVDTLATHLTNQTADIEKLNADLAIAKQAKTIAETAKANAETALATAKESAATELADAQAKIATLENDLAQANEKLAGRAADPDPLTPGADGGDPQPEAWKEKSKNYIHNQFIETLFK